MSCGRFVFLFFLLTIVWANYAVAQQKAKKRVEIERANSFEYNDRIVSNAQRIIGDVQIRHNTIVMWCDSAWSYTDRNMVDAFGNVHILKDDTLNLYADFINYDGDRKYAKARKNVKLENKGTTLITDSLDFDMIANIGYYDYFGTITDSANVLTSMIGQYFTKTDMAHFKKDVVATTEKYRLFSDTLIYKVSEKVAFIVGPTTIEDDSTTLYTENGFYNTVSGETQLLKKPQITDRKHKVLADSIFYNKTTGDGRAVGDVHIEDFENRMIVKGNRVVFNELENTSLVTDSALFIQYSEKDSLFLHADTLRMIPDTTGVDARLIKAYFKVKFFRDDMQGKCDSLAYWSKDSTIQLFNEPVIWTGGNQMTARYIEMIKNAGKPDEVLMKGDAFIIAMEPDSIRFNQIKGRNMTGYIRNNELFKIFVDGNGQSLYYARDKEGIIGLNKAESSSITITMEKNKVKRIAFISNPEGALNPIPQLQEEDTKLPGFTWMDLLRPKTIPDIFKRK
ncbi:MAG: OstA-like protein [Prolixibacteraceae bacterium]|jgi:lipopolysaccharide export system protein LptA|nr:OstA-like protein [Prolixibacteraceae bacterium]